jgi:hypothetical protein
MVKKTSLLTGEDVGFSPQLSQGGKVKGLLEVVYLIICEYCERVKWCNKWMRFNEIDKEELKRQEVYWKYVTCKDCAESDSKIADGADGQEN